jgi:hypothetical protein
LTASSELQSQLVDGVVKVTSLVLQCDTYQELYIPPDLTIRPPQAILDALETVIVQAYVKSLLFLGFAIQRQRSRTKVIDAPFLLGDVEKYIKSLVESGEQLAQAADNCEKHCNHLDRSWVKELRGLAAESRPAMRNQAYV